MPVTIDPRHHDAVLFDAALPPAPPLLDRLRAVHVGTAVAAPDGLIEAAQRLSTRPGRCAVVASDEPGATAARDAGFALVIAVGPNPVHGADAVVADVNEIDVRTGDKRMSELPDAVHAVDLAGAAPAVFFDFDGTLSDIVNNPDAARPVAGAAEALQELAAQCPVAILSGRDLADVSKRVGLPGIWYAGSHGFELTAPDGTHHQNEEAATAIPVLEQAAAQLREQLGSIPGVVVEHKRFGVAVHYRNAARDRVGEVAAAVRNAGQRDALRVTTGREVIELRPNLDWDKGKTLRWVMEHLGAQAGPRLPVYLGDDITDEDAFDAVRADGIPILVRHNDDGDRATAALYALDSPAQAAEFTRQLARQLSDAGVN
ncbi:trehalose-phosphatase [Mycobacterium paragordonae]|uniref:trehalose-phosphatase n=1 Tax=Mycobacterium paragordonae TaxID=1389713 RepID=UPI00105EA6F6|nr:trehalose-phosphatase [Mycobacterium paragordonae]TDK98861.1 trehalose-phosphatase [Mycobacterium paragordonae]TDL09184.1 trehalose-phosphatase [Mycobacterium paragordonae]